MFLIIFCVLLVLAVGAWSPAGVLLLVFAFLWFTGNVHF
jgi:hypothetical protein